MTSLIFVTERVRECGTSDLRNCNNSYSFYIKVFDVLHNSGLGNIYFYAEDAESKGCSNNFRDND